MGKKPEVILDGASELIKTISRKDLSNNFPYLHLGNFVLSIQGGERYYSKPKENFATITSYSCVEIAIFEKSDKNCMDTSMSKLFKNWISPRSDPRFKNFSWAEYFEDYNDKPVAMFVPKKELKQIVEDVFALNKKGFD